MNIKAHFTRLIVMATLTISCCGQKAATSENLTTTTVKETTFDTTGYTAGTIVQSTSEGDCEWTIALEDGRYVEGTGMDKDLLIDGATVWLKYALQRRMQRCKKASPVAIIEMVKREN